MFAGEMRRVDGGSEDFFGLASDWSFPLRSNRDSSVGARHLSGDLRTVFLFYWLIMLYILSVCILYMR